MIKRGVEMNNARVAYMDAAKAYLIFLVVLGHILIVLNPGYDKLYFTVIQEFIYAFHMPAFFIIHGALFHNEKWSSAPTIEFVKKRLYSLIVPYLFFEVIGIFWRAIFQRQSFLDGLLHLLTIRCNVGADWFLPAMFMGSLLFLIYVKHPNRVYGIASTAASFILPIFMSGHQLTIVLGRGLMAYGFIMTGNLAKALFLPQNVKRLSWLSGSLFVTAAAAAIGLKFGGNDFYTCTVNNPATLLIGGVSGTILVLGISVILQCKMITYIGNHHTLTIMGTHQLVIYALSALMPRLYGGSMLKGVVLLAAIIVFEIPVVWLLDRYLPFCVGKKPTRP